MEFVERALGFVEACHRRLSSFCLKVVGALWAWQGRRSLSFRLAVGFFPLVLVAVWCAYLVSGGYVAAKEFDESLVRYLERAGHLAAGARLAWRSSPQRRFRWRRWCPRWRRSGFPSV